MAAANKPLVVIIAFLLAAASAIPLPDGSGGGGNLPFTTLLPAQPPGAAAVSSSSLPNDAGGGAGADLAPFTLLHADPTATAVGCRGSSGTCPTRDEVPALSAAAAVTTMAADLERVRRRVHHQQRDSVPCSRRGVSYYNCRSGGAQGNPYRRACSRIKHCHG